MATDNPAIAGAANVQGTGGFFSGLLNLISKGADTYVELQTIKGAKPASDATPTESQTNPDAGGGKLAQNFNWQPWAIGGGILLGVIVVTAIVVKAVK